MKKIIFCIAIILSVFITGCGLGNTPTAKVEDLLSKYQTNDDSISNSYYELVGEISVNDEDKDRYKEVISKQYKNMVYEVKDEKIDGDTAIVEVQVDVMDYKSVMNKYNIIDYNTDQYNELILNDLEKVEDKVTYTIEFGLTKNDKGDWSVDDLTTEQSDKLLGIY